MFHGRLAHRCHHWSGHRAAGGRAPANPKGAGVCGPCRQQAFSTIQPHCLRRPTTNRNRRCTRSATCEFRHRLLDVRDPIALDKGQRPNGLRAHAQPQAELMQLRGIANRCTRDRDRPSSQPAARNQLLESNPSRALQVTHRQVASQPQRV